MNKIFIFLINLYQKFPDFSPSRCIYLPSCSEYAKEAFKKYSFFKAFFLVVQRILRCNPLARGGFDPIR